MSEERVEQRLAAVLAASDPWAVILLGGFRDTAEHRHLGGYAGVGADLLTQRQI
jgi:hypothetical protein